MTLKNIPNIRTGKYYPFEIDTEIGVLQMNLRNGRLFCNFIGGEEKAKLIFGHWKVNTVINNKEDIVLHLKYINEKIERYKNNLKNGKI